MRIQSEDVILEFSDLSFRYDRNRRVLYDIDLSIREGENIAIVGANGAGKSTLMKLAVGLLVPEKGMVTVDGTRLVPKTMKDARRKIGYAFQDPDHQLFMPTVYEDIAFQSRQEGIAEEEIEGIVEKALMDVDALHLMGEAPHKLSGGEKRMVSLAAVFAVEPKILVLDEPTVGLDPKSRRNLIDFLKKRSETKVITTHDMDMALELCDRIVVLLDGKIVTVEEPGVLFQDRELLKNCHLEQPLAMQGCPVCGT